MKTYFQLMLRDPGIKKSILYMLGYLFLFRFGLMVLLPDIGSYFYESYSSYPSLSALPQYQYDSPGIFLLMLGIGPYYLASLLAPLLFPTLNSKPAGTSSNFSGVRNLTLVLAMVQAYLYVNGTGQYSSFTMNSASPMTFWFSWFVLVTGAMLCMWIAERITAQGLVDGRILMLGLELFVQLPWALWFEIETKVFDGAFFVLGVEIAALGFVLMGIIGLMQAFRPIPIEFRKNEEEVNAFPKEGKLILPFNLVDEYPIAIAGGLVILANSFSTFYAANDLQGTSFYLSDIYVGGELIEPYGESTMSIDVTSYWFILLTFVLVVVATYVYLAMLIKPKYYAETLKNYEAYIPGIQPGHSTEAYLKGIIEKMALPLAFCLGLISIMPPIFDRLFGTTFVFQQYCGGLMLFVAVSAILDFVGKINARLSNIEDFDTHLLGRNIPADLTAPKELDFLFEIDVEEEE